MASCESCPVDGKSILVCTESYGNIDGVSLRLTTLNIDNYLRQCGARINVVAPSSLPLQATKFTYNTSTGTHVSVIAPSGSSPLPAIRLSGCPIPYNPDVSAVYPVRIDRLCQRFFGQLSDLIYLASPATLGFQFLLQLQLLNFLPAWSRIPIICNFQTNLSSYVDIYFPSPFSLLLKWTLRSTESALFSHHSVKRVLYPSSSVHDYLISLSIPSHKLKILPGAVDTNFFNPIKSCHNFLHSPDARRKLILLSVSRLSHEMEF